MEQTQEIQQSQTQETKQEESSYEAKDIQVLAGLSAVRKTIDVIELYHNAKRRGDVQRLSKRLRIKPRTLALAKTHPVFNYYRKLFYKNNFKAICQDLLEHLNSRSLAIWTCDDGSFSKKQGYIILCTNSFNFEEHKLMKEFFNKRFGLTPTIGFRDKKYYYLRFNKEDSRKLIEIVRPFVPDCMKYKIGE